MEELTNAFVNAFRSERLIYRDVDNTDADKEWMYKFGHVDHVSLGLSNPSMLKDQGKKASFDLITKMLESGLLLKVFICLPAEESAEEAAETAKLGPGERGAKARASAIPIGQLTLTSLLPGMGPFTRLGISLGEQYQNKGYGSEAINWAVDWAFKFGNVNKVEIGTVSYNERAAALYPRLGFKPESQRREVVYMNGKYYDMLGWGLLKREWEELRGLNRNSR